jgi:hypothetical protein
VDARPGAGRSAATDAATPGAQRVVVSLGFRNIGRFEASADGRSYEVLIRPETDAAAAHG